MAIRLGELLLKAKVITEAQLEAALAEQEKWGGKLGDILVRMGHLSEDLLVKALAKQLGIPRVDMEKSTPSTVVLQKVRRDLAESYGVMPLELKDDGQTLVIAMSDPKNIRAIDELKATTGCRTVQPLIAGEQEIRRAIARYYMDVDTDVGQAGSDDFKIVDAQGRTVMKRIDDIAAEAAAARGGGGAPAARPGAAPAGPPPRPSDPNLTGSDEDPALLLARLEKTHRREVQALKGIVELLIEKGVFTREEYLAKVSSKK
ncbi:MAG: general secretion pathway protein GspE [Deltaproteobacteria bacterium]|nr:MAG: general secretion pathway protein GspE [Deltaproteobacteria bacterium]